MGLPSAAANTIKTDGTRLIDRIVYIASLATNRTEIDPYLDVLRSITARSKLEEIQLSEANKNALNGLESQLKNYLVSREKVRLFTAESLDLQIEQHINGHGTERSLNRLAAVFLGGALIAALLAALLVPLDSLDERLQLASAASVGVLGIGAASLFLNALSAFRSQLRQAFILICIGVGVLGLGFAYLAANEVFGLVPKSVSDILDTLPFMIMAVMMTWGIQTYARLMDVTSRLLSRKLTLILGVLAPAILFGLSLLGSNSESETTPVADAISTLMLAWMLLFVVISIFVLPRIIKQAADLYRPPIRALRLAIFSTFLVIITSGLAELGIGNLGLTGTYRTFVYILVMVMGGLYLYAGYTFNRVSRY